VEQPRLLQRHRITLAVGPLQHLTAQPQSIHAPSLEETSPPRDRESLVAA
jgi:hypothetical protein